MSAAASRKLLQAILDEGWAEPRIDDYVERIRTTDPTAQRLQAERPNLATAHVTLLANENHIVEFSRQVKQVAEALIKHIDTMSQHGRQFVQLVTEPPNAGMFPVRDSEVEALHQRVTLIVPPFLDGALIMRQDLFWGYHSRYGVSGIAVEVITSSSKVNTRLHVQVADRPLALRDRRASYGYVTIDPDGSIGYERFAVEEDLRALPEVSFGLQPRECLVTTRAIGAPNQTTNLDRLFPNAKHQLAQDLPLLPEFIVDIARSLTHNGSPQGF